METAMETMRTEEERYLAETIALAREKLEEVCRQLGENARDLESMNDYFWQNYAEFDEYGYEMYDNRMAWKTGLNRQESYVRDRQRYEKMLGAPYFGRVDFCYEGETEPEVYYIGIGNLADHSQTDCRVYDWRAPVSGLFYEYDRGKASFEAPAGVMQGEITRKRQYKIRDGRLLFVLETEQNIDDEILQQTLSENADAKLKSIVNTIQREQNQIIRDRSHKILVVQGCAGSGKTSVALHRAAWLLYYHRKTLRSSQVLILSPNSIFGDYISRILPELGEENICEMTLDDFAYRELRPCGEAEDKYDELERRLHGQISPEAFDKQSREYVRELDRFVLEQEWKLVDIRDIQYQKLTMSGERISDLFYEKFCDVPILSRMEKIAAYLIDEWETLHGRDMEEEEQEAVRNKFNRMYRKTNVLELYQEFLTCTGRAKQLIEGTVIPYEDVYPILYLQYALRESPKRRQVKHLIVDEMQDYTYLQFRILQKLFDCEMTILGDRMQTMEDKPRDVMRFLPEIFGKDLRYVRMEKSYRSTSEIMAYANSILPGKNGTDSVSRHGKQPVVLEMANREEQFYRIAELLKTSGDNSGAVPEKLREQKDGACSGYHTQAVLCLDQESASETWEMLKIRGVEAALLTKESMKFRPGISVMPFYLAKGLEFDEVIVPDLQNYRTPLHRQALYINATRALHELHLYKAETGRIW